MSIYSIHIIFPIRNKQKKRRNFADEKKKKRTDVCNSITDIEYNTGREIKRREGEECLKKVARLLL